MGDMILCVPYPMQAGLSQLATSRVLLVQWAQCSFLSYLFSEKCSFIGKQLLMAPTVTLDPSNHMCSKCLSPIYLAPSFLLVNHLAQV